MRAISASLVVVAAILAACSSSSSSPNGSNNGADASTNGGKTGGDDTGKDSGSNPGDDGGVTPTDSGGGSDTSIPDDATTTTQNETWHDGKQLASSVVIAAGVTVTIDPGATVTIAAGASIIVQGTLTSSAYEGGAHGSISAPSAWGGIVVASGGTLLLDGFDLTAGGVVAQGGNTDAEFDHGTIDSATPTFQVDKGGTLSTKHSVVTNPGVKTIVNGTFNASYLDYDEHDTHAIWCSDKSAHVFIEDSSFHNSGQLGQADGPDLLNAAGCGFFHIAYSDVSGAHCGFHFENGGADTIEIDHTTIHTMVNGADIWGSPATGIKTITASNFEDGTEGLDVTGSNGTITVSGCYFAPALSNPGFPGAGITRTNDAANPISDAHPR